MTFNLTADELNKTSTVVAQMPFRAMVRNAYSDIDPTRLTDGELVKNLIALNTFTGERWASVNGNYLREANRRRSTLTVEARHRGFIAD